MWVPRRAVLFAHGEAFRATGAAVKARGAGIAAGRTPQGALFADEVRNTELSQWFTPPWLAERIVTWAGLPPGARVLEPSAGDGAFVRAGPGLRWTAIELDERQAMKIAALQGRPLRITVEVKSGYDFLECTPETGMPEIGLHDAVIMNPPYEGDADIDHVLHAFDFTPRVIALLRSAFRHGEERFTRFWRWVDPVRIAELAGRPRFGGNGAAMSDFSVYELRKRATARGRGEPAIVEVEWW